MTASYTRRPVSCNVYSSLSNSCDTISCFYGDKLQPVAVCDQEPEDRWAYRYWYTYDGGNVVMVNKSEIESFKQDGLNLYPYYRRLYKLTTYAISDDSGDMSFVSSIDVLSGESVQKEELYIPQITGIGFSRIYPETWNPVVQDTDLCLIYNSETLTVTYHDNVPYVLSLDANGGTLVGESSYDMRTEEDYPEINDPTKDYHGFGGWAIKVDDKLSVVSTTGECPFSSDTTLYGTYSPCEYDITYETDGHGTTPTKTSYFYGESYTPSSLTEHGYEFQGWTPECITPTTHGDVNFVASWTFTKRFTVTFDTDGGTEVESRSVISGETIGELPQTTKEDYTLMGWVDDKQLNVTPAYVVTADITIHAKYI